METKPSVRVRVAEDGDAPAVAGFFREVWDPAATADSVLRGRAESAATNPVEPGLAPPSILALQGERVIGFVGSLPARFWNGGEELPGYWIKGLMVLPEFQGGPIGFLVLREAARRIPRSGALAVALAARRLFGALGYRDVGPVTNYVRVLRGGRVAARLNLDALGIDRAPAIVRRLIPIAQRSGLASLGGALVGEALRVRAALPRLASRRHEIGASRVPDAQELDQLWQSARPAVRAAAVRDGVEFDLRYGASAGAERARYRFASVRSQGRLVGVASVREPRVESDPRLAGIAVATLSDAWFDLRDDDAGLATLGAAERTARTMGADALLCSTSHPGLAQLLRRQAYFSVGANIHFLFRDTTDAQASWPAGLESWWVSRGDARSDDVF
jgi:predicted N-acetyltransferase YhbS